MNLSVVVPVFNEEKNINILYQELIDVLIKLDLTFEIIFIDDGSTDKSLAILSELQENDSRIVVISFRRNFGQTAALSAGFDYARGNIIITLDGDLQNDPEDIPKLLQKLSEGYDIVNGWRFDRKDSFFSRRLPSIIANKIISYSTNVKLHDYGCTLKAFRKEITQNIKLYGEMHRFIPAIASGMGSSVAEVKVNHRARKFGKSKYGISRTIRVVLDLITVKFLLSYATRPLQIFGLLGFSCGIIGFCMAIYLTIQRQFYGISLANRPALLLAILLIFMGLQFVTLGLLAELQSRTYHEAQNKPIYSIRNILRKNGKSSPRNDTEFH
ncbi:MAG: glycosyltransferase family 2 protein [Deltaproteobacteria bacterium]|nr:glycosyltransferase family 2 protein [Deltaproteobacteria bacterium]MDL1988929.1 glycosyltransferase family 2 protein [Deltaproteobacteria bacterium]